MKAVDAIFEFVGVRTELRIALVLWSSLAAFGCSVPIARGLDEQEANHAVLSLQRGHIAANKEADPRDDKLWTVTVSHGDVTQAVSLLASEGPLIDKTPGLLESLGASSLIPSPRTERVRVLAGTAGELERSLREIEGVLSARVHLAIPTADSISNATEPVATTASVLIRFRDGLTPISENEVKRLVAGAVAGLTADQVSVVLKSVSPISTKNGIERLGPLSVSTGSLRTLRGIVATAVGVNLLLFAGILWLWRRVRQLQA
jgi:type III secretion protein J